MRDESFVCPGGDAYPVVNGIPRFVDASSYAAAFGVQWHCYRRTQLDSYSGLSLSRDRLRQAIGEDTWSSLSAMDVLECGCGAGRFTEVLLNQGAGVTSIDLGNAVDANKENCPSAPAHRLAQADIIALPFEPNGFHLVLCVGVLQHTASPEEMFALDHYAFPRNWYTRTAPLFRAVLRRVAPDSGLRFTERLVKLLLPIHRSARRSRWANTILTRLSPVASFYREFPQLSDELQREWPFLDTHDALTDWYKHFRSERSIRKHLQSLGVVEVETFRKGGVVVARAVKLPSRSLIFTHRSDADQKNTPPQSQVPVATLSDFP